MRFVSNFVISWLGYAIINLIGYLMRYILYPDIGLWWEWGIKLSSYKWPAWIQFIVHVIWLFLNIGIPCILYFILGTKLNLLESHGLNYLSVSSSLIFVGIFIAMCLHLNSINSEILWNISASFGYGLNYLNIVFKNEVIAAYITAILPSIITWLGMLYQSKKI